MHSGNCAAMPPARKDATLSFCHASKSVRIATAILVSNCMNVPRCHSRMRRRRRPGTSSFIISGFSDVQLHILVRANARPGMTVANSSPGVAGPGADDAFLAAEFVALPGGSIERGGNLGLHGIAVRATRVLQINRQRRAGALHGDGRALALA